MIAVAGGIILAVLIICMLIGFALMVPHIFRAIRRRCAAYNISIVRGLPPGSGKRWIRIAVIFVVVIGMGYVVGSVSQPNLAVRQLH